jgi:hypothetical protein
MLEQNPNDPYWILMLQVVEEGPEGVSTNRFTPLHHSEKVRMHMRLTAADHRKLTRGPGFKAVVTDLLTGIKWWVYGAACGLPYCWCDPVVYESDRRSLRQRRPRLPKA